MFIFFELDNNVYWLQEILYYDDLIKSALFSSTKQKVWTLRCSKV